MADLYSKRLIKRVYDDDALTISDNANYLFDNLCTLAINNPGWDGALYPGQVRQALGRLRSKRRLHHLRELVKVGWIEVPHDDWLMRAKPRKVADAKIGEVVIKNFARHHPAAKLPNENEEVEDGRSLRGHYGVTKGSLRGDYGVTKGSLRGNYGCQNANEINGRAQEIEIEKKIEIEKGNGLKETSLSQPAPPDPPWPFDEFDDQPPPEGTPPPPSVPVVVPPSLGDGDVLPFDPQPAGQSNALAKSRPERHEDSIREAFGLYEYLTERKLRKVHSGRKDWRQLKALFKDGHPVTDVYLAVVGCLSTPHNQGATNGTRYIDFELITRRDKFERFLARGREVLAIPFGVDPSLGELEEARGNITMQDILGRQKSAAELREAKLLAGGDPYYGKEDCPF